MREPGRPPEKTSGDRDRGAEVQRIGVLFLLGEIKGGGKFVPTNGVDCFVISQKGGEKKKKKGAQKGEKIPKIPLKASCQRGRVSGKFP